MSDRLGEMQPTIYRFKLGGFEVATIMDSKVIRDGLHPSFGGERRGRRGEGAGRGQQHRSDRFEHRSRRSLVNTGKELVLFDTGNGALPREYEQLKGRLPPGKLVARMARPATSRKTSTSW